MDGGSILIAFSDIQGGEAGIVTSENDTIIWGEGNIDADPLFLDPDNGDYSLQEGSPCIATFSHNELDRDTSVIILVETRLIWIN